METALAVAIASDKLDCASLIEPDEQKREEAWLALQPADATIWKVAQDPFALFVLALSVTPTLAINVWVFVALFFLIDKKDEFQLGVEPKSSLCLPCYEARQAKDAKGARVILLCQRQPDPLQQLGGVPEVLDMIVTHWTVLEELNWHYYLY